MPDEKSPSPQPDHGKVVLNWQFPEFPSYKRSQVWYISAAIVGAILVIWSIATNNYLFAIIIVMLGVIIIAQSRRKPHNVVVEITEDGVVLGNDFYQYRDIKNFYLVYEPPVTKKLFIIFKSSIRPSLPIQLENENPVKVRQALRQYIDEDLDKESEPTTDSLSRLMKI
ncbi:hypothetical protein ACFL04_03695 [Patescibacteria group bacterium]